MMLEEAILYLLRASGYLPVASAPASPSDSPLRGSLRAGGLILSGRGSEHQIDAIADFALSLPFSNPHRLLVEAKSYARDRSIGVRYVRNAVGVLKDVQEYWVGRNGVPARGRHHYQYAIFSTSGFTDVAQEYAFAHDIYLVPLAGSRFMNAIVESIRETTAAHFRAENSQNIAIDQAQLRQRLRDEITHDGEGQLDNLIDVPEGLAHLRAFVDNCREVNEAFISVVGDRFPLFLVPAEGVDVFRMPGADPVRIVVRDGNWFVVSQDGDRLFSFDIPPEFFELYDQWADLTPESIYTIKKRFLHSIQIIATRQGRVRVITLELDREWLRRVREGLGRVKRYKE